MVSLRRLESQRDVPILSDMCGLTESSSRAKRRLAEGEEAPGVVEDQEVLVEHLHLVTEREPRIAERVYERLFQRHPQLRKLFGAQAVAVQQDMLNETLMGVVDSLEGMAGLESNLQLLGAKHAEFDVGDEMYAWWTESILEILSEASGSDWSPRLERLWRGRMDYLCTLMRQGARRAS